MDLDSNSPIQFDNSRGPSKTWTFGRYQQPVIGVILDYLSSSLEFFQRRGFVAPLMVQHGAPSSPTLLVALVVGLALLSVVRVDVVAEDREQMGDLPSLLVSKDHHLYVDDVEINRVQLHADLAQMLAAVASSVLFMGFFKLDAPYNVYATMPWLGLVPLRLLDTQAPAALGFIYVQVAAEGRLRVQLCILFTLLLFEEIRLWIEVAKVACSQWNRHRLEKLRKYAGVND